ncbi:MAG: hypothetical protein AB1585_08995 [Thermodesulfobacteriota bacterium]
MEIAAGGVHQARIDIVEVVDGVGVEIPVDVVDRYIPWIAKPLIANVLIKEGVGQNCTALGDCCGSNDRATISSDGVIAEDAVEDG